MSEALLAALNAAAVADPFTVQSRGGATVPVPPEQVAALVGYFRAGIAAGKGDGFTCPIIDEMFVTGRSPVLNADGSAVLNADGTPLTYISAVQPWTSVSNPAESYSKALQAVLCECKGGDGSAVWIGQGANTVEHGPPNTEGKRAKVSVRAGLVLRSLIPKSAKVDPSFAHLQAK
jgi:hypothetical protein